MLSLGASLCVPLGLDLVILRHFVAFISFRLKHLCGINNVAPKFFRKGGGHGLPFHAEALWLIGCKGYWLLVAATLVFIYLLFVCSWPSSEGEEIQAVRLPSGALVSTNVEFHSGKVGCHGQSVKSG